MDNIHSVDLVDMSTPKLMDKKGNWKYILCIIDIYTRYAWAIPLKSKKAPEVYNAYIKLTKNRKAKVIYCDEGNEFYNVEFKLKGNYSKEKGTMYSTFGGLYKSSIVERFNRTLKNMMFKNFTEKATHEWAKYIPDFIKQYNESPHRTLQRYDEIKKKIVYMSPNDAIKKESQPILKKLWYPDAIEPQYNSGLARVPKYKYGDFVRISYNKNVFEKGYERAWSSEEFHVDKVFISGDERLPITYTIREYPFKDDNVLRGRFYESELQIISKKTRNLFILDYIVSKDTPKKKVLVKWLGIRDKYNSWEPMSNYTKKDYAKIPEFPALYTPPDEKK